MSHKFGFELSRRPGRLVRSHYGSCLGELYVNGGQVCVEHTVQQLQGGQVHNCFTSTAAR